MISKYANSVPSMLLQQCISGKVKNKVITSALKKLYALDYKIAHAVKEKEELLRGVLKNHD